MLRTPQHGRRLPIYLKKRHPCKSCLASSGRSDGAVTERTPVHPRASEPGPQHGCLRSIYRPRTVAWAARARLRKSLPRRRPGTGQNGAGPDGEGAGRDRRVEGSAGCSCPADGGLRGRARRQRLGRVAARLQARRRGWWPWRRPAASRRWRRRRWPRPACRRGRQPGPGAPSQALGQRAKTDPIDAASSPISPRRPGPRSGRCRTRRPGCWPISSPAPRADHRDDRGRKPAREAATEPRLRRASPACSTALQKELTSVDTDIDEPCAARRPGATRRTCSPPCRASARPSRAR